MAQRTGCAVRRICQNANTATPLNSTARSFSLAIRPFSRPYSTETHGETDPSTPFEPAIHGQPSSHSRGTPGPLPTRLHNSPRKQRSLPLKHGRSPQYDLTRAPTKPTPLFPSPQNQDSSSSKPRNKRLRRDELSSKPLVHEAKEPEQDALHLSPTIREHLVQLTSQPPFFAQIYIYGRAYLVTAGDTIRLPFLMHGVMPGDVLRLDRATVIGSRDWSLLAGTAANSVQNTKAGKSRNTNADDVDNTNKDASITSGPQIVGNTQGLPPSTPYPVSSTDESSPLAGFHRQGPKQYLDDRMFVIRATVVATESEPLRIKEKTKRRQRHIKRVKSKHRFTVLRVGEIQVKKLEDLEEEASES